MFKGDNYFDMNNIPSFAKDYFEKPNYFKFEKRIEVELTHMSPENYTKECWKIHKGSLDRKFEMIDFDKSMKYSKLMKQGAKFPVPYLDYVDKNQEGRHRAFAVEILINTSQIEPTKIPVYIIKKANFTKDERKNYLIKKYGEKIYNMYYK